MARWSEFQAEAPELAATVRRFLYARIHKTIATLRRDGSPRISGTETEFLDGDLTIGSMWKAMKALDLRRDPRFELHSGSEDPPGWDGDARVWGRMLEDPPFEHAGSPAHRFRADLEGAAVVRLNDARDKLVIETWRPGRRVTRVER
jgi:hypothetical protein